MTFRLNVALLITCMLCTVSNVYAATLTLGTVSGAPQGKLTVVPVSLANATGDEVSGIQVDVQFDATALTFQSAAAGDAATTAGKDVSADVLSAGTVRVIVEGLNQTAIGDGVVALLTFSVGAFATPGSYAMTPAGIIMVDPDGLVVTATGVAGSVGVVVALAADFNPYPAWGKPPLTVEFTGIVNEDPARVTEWQWQFGDGTMLEGNYPTATHVYSQEGSYSVTLTAMTATETSSATKPRIILVSNALPLSRGAVYALAVTLLMTGLALLRKKRAMI